MNNVKTVLDGAFNSVKSMKGDFENQLPGMIDSYQKEMDSSAVDARGVFNKLKMLIDLIRMKFESKLGTTNTLWHVREFADKVLAANSKLVQDVIQIDQNLTERMKSRDEQLHKVEKYVNTTIQLPMNGIPYVYQDYVQKLQNETNQLVYSRILNTTQELDQLHGHVALRFDKEIENLIKFVKFLSISDQKEQKQLDTEIAKDSEKIEKMRKELASLQKGLFHSLERALNQTSAQESQKNTDDKDLKQIFDRLELNCKEFASFLRSVSKTINKKLEQNEQKLYSEIFPRKEKIVQKAIVKVFSPMLAHMKSMSGLSNQTKKITDYYGQKLNSEMERILLHGEMAVEHYLDNLEAKLDYIFQSKTDEIFQTIMFDHQSLDQMRREQVNLKNVSDTLEKMFQLSVLKLESSASSSWMDMQLNAGKFIDDYSNQMTNSVKRFFIEKMASFSQYEEKFLKNVNPQVSKARSELKKLDDIKMVQNEVNKLLTDVNRYSASLQDKWLTLDGVTLKSSQTKLNQELQNYQGTIRQQIFKKFDDQCAALKSNAINYMKSKMTYIQSDQDKFAQSIDELLRGNDNDIVLMQTSVNTLDNFIRTNKDQISVNW